jgi:hypothetical protein
MMRELRFSNELVPCVWHMTCRRTTFATVAVTEWRSKVSEVKGKSAWSVLPSFELEDGLAVATVQPGQTPEEAR